MPDNPNTWQNLWAWIAASPAVIAAIWGALGGTTNALVIRVTTREALRHIAIGALVAAGMGATLGGAFLSKIGFLPEEVMTELAGAGIGSVAYMLGSIGAAAIEVIILRFKPTRKPPESNGKGM